MKQGQLIKMVFSSSVLFTNVAWATDFPVTTTGDGNVAGTLRYAINSYNAVPTGSDTITITLSPSSIITLTSSLPPLNGGSGNAVTIDATAASGLTISGAASFQPFFVNSGNVSIVGNSTAPMTLLNGNAAGSLGGAGVGGAGGGGGSAGGGAVFVNSGSTVSISNCQLTGSHATGGTGGTGGVGSPGTGGSGGGGAGSFGGGAGGAGGNVLVGGGGGGGGFPGGGAGGAGGDPNGIPGGNNTLVGGGGGGGGTGSSNPPSTGGTGIGFTNNGGSGGNTSTRENPGFGLGGGGGGGNHDGSIGQTVSPGGPLGGGGGGGGVDSTLINGGSGGFGAGGGGGNCINSGNGGAGGFGGGGGGGGGSTGTGGTSTLGGTGGSGGTSSGNNTGGGGGGGAAFGGAVFIHKSATFTIGDNPAISGSGVTGGAGGVSGGGTATGGGTGSALGTDIFMMEGGTLNYNSSGNLVLANPIQSDNGAGGGTGGGLVVNGPGSLTINGTNTYLGGTTLNAGTLAFGAGATILGNIAMNGGTLNLSGAGATTLSNPTGSVSSGIALGTSDLTVTTTTSSVFDGTLSGGPNNIIMDPNAVWTLTNGNNLNTSTWLLGSGSVLTGLVDGSFGNTAGSVNFDPGAAATATLSSSSSTTISRPLTITSGTGAVNAGANTVTLNSGTSGAGHLQAQGTAGGAVQVPRPLAHGSGTTLTNTSPLPLASGTFTLAIQGPSGTLPNGGDVTLGTATTLDMSDPTISGQAQTVGNYNGSGNTILGSNTININLSNDSQYDGNFSDSTSANLGTGNGTVIINSSGSNTMTLTGNNTHSGGTKVKSAALAFCQDNNLGSTGKAIDLGIAPADLPILRTACSQVLLSRGMNINADKVVVQMGTNTLTQDAGGTAGTGQLHVGQTGDSSSGAFVSKQPLSHTGGTHVDGGVLRLQGSSASLPPSRDVSVNGPTGQLDLSDSALPPQSIGNFTGSGHAVAKLGPSLLTISPNTSGVYSGDLTGSNAQLVLSPPSSVTLTIGGTADHSGSTAIQNGTMAFTGMLNSSSSFAISAPASLDVTAAVNPLIGPLSGGGTVNIGTQTLQHVASADTTFSGALTGGNSSIFNNNGPATFTLTGASPFTGTLQVTQGTVQIGTAATPSASVQGPVTVAPNGILAGHGTAQAITNHGTVRPGGSIGTLTTTTNYDEFGTLEIEVNNLGQSSQLTVVGNATINPGSTLLIDPDTGTYATTTTYTVMTVGGTGTGQYSTVATSNPNRFTVTAIYNNFAVANAMLGAAGDPFIQIVLGVIPFSKHIKHGHPGAVAKCFDSLVPTPGGDLEKVILALESLDIAQQCDAFNEMQPSQFGALALAQENNNILIRSTITHRLDELYPIVCAQENQQNTNNQQGNKTNSKKTMATPTPQPKRKGGVWFAPLGKYAHQHHEQHNLGYNLATGGALAGADYEVLRHTRFGAALGYTFTDLTWHHSSGDADINSYYGSFYGNWYCKRVFIDGSIIGSYNHYHASRNIDFPGIHRHARNEHGGYELAGSLGTGLLFYPGHYQIQPYARADYIFTHQGSFKEHGAKSIDLKVGDRESRYVRSDLGFKVTGCYTFEKVKFRPYFKAGWIWEKQLDNGRLEASFKDSSCEFRVKGLHPVRSLFAPSMGFTTLAYQDFFAFSLNYDAEISRKFWENRASLNFEFRY